MLRANLSARRGPGPCPRRAAPPCPAAAPQRARHVAGASAPAAPGAGAGGDAGQPVMLNNWHTLWLQGAGAARPVLFGGDYVLLPSEQAPASAPPRGAAGAGPAPGLVPWRRPGGLSVVPPAIPNAGLVSAARLAAAGLVVVPAGETGIVPYGGAPVALQGCGYIEAEAVDAEVLPPVPPADADLPPTTTAIVPRPRAACDLGDLGDLEAPDPDQEVVYESDNTFSPRRGHKIKFTCRRCGGVNIKPVNIHAWREVRGWLLVGLGLGVEGQLPRVGPCCDRVPSTSTRGARCAAVVLVVCCM